MGFSSFLADGLLLFSGSLRNSEQAMPFSFLPRYHSVPERASWGTEWTRGTVEGLLVYATRFQRLSVQKTGAFGTEEIFGTQNPPPTVRGAFHHFIRALHRKQPPPPGCPKSPLLKVQSAFWAILAGVELTEGVLFGQAPPGGINEKSSLSQRGFTVS